MVSAANERENFDNVMPGPPLPKRIIYGPMQIARADGRAFFMHEYGSLQE
jgi:hypothetical protein